MGDWGRGSEGVRVGEGVSGLGKGTLERRGRRAEGERKGKW